jgi:hypothetical protein
MAPARRKPCTEPSTRLCARGAGPRSRLAQRARTARVHLGPHTARGALDYSRILSPRPPAWPSARL